MPLGNEIGKFLWAIGEQTDGFKFGKPWRNSSKSLGLVIPILREKDIKRKYQMMEEAKGKIDIKDTGSVNVMRVFSNADVNVFIRSGVILSGAGQTRATVSGMVVIPNSNQDIDVKCVYASKPTHAGAKMEAVDVAPPIVMQSLHDSQRDTWNAVSYFAQTSGIRARHGGGSRMHARLGFSGEDRVIGSAMHFDEQESVSDDLLGVMKEVEKSQKSVEGAIKDIPVMKDQVGAIIFDVDSIVGFEVFDSPKSWAAMHQKVLSKYGEVIRKEQEDMLFELKPEVVPKKISEFIEELTKSDEKTTHTNEVSKTIVIDGDRHVGEYTMIGADVIHVIAFKRERAREQRQSARPVTEQNRRTRIRSSLDDDEDVPRRREQSVHVGILNPFERNRYRCFY